MQQIIKNQLNKSIEYLEQELVTDKLKVKKLRNSWLQILKKIILYV
ncbi:MAG: hypothetical protein RBT22_08095 [Aliarcobacter sp.]|jgi:hypothetical protein|nr:hypothetical protein [Arcobacter venerupis]MDX9901436.1 hypothetical protein [Aliarcobacter sp.]